MWTRVPEEWAAFVDRVRTRLSEAGYDLGPYRLHVTLARVPIKSIRQWMFSVGSRSGLVP